MKLFASLAVASSLVETAVSAGTVSPKVSVGSPKNSEPLPHLIFVLTDDNGWAGVGYNNPNLNTPTLDHLAETGLKLTSHYAYKYCAPTRGVFPSQPASMSHFFGNARISVGYSITVVWFFLFCSATLNAAIHPRGVSDGTSSLQTRRNAVQSYSVDASRWDTPVVHHAA